ncbi:hypothetical protein [Mycobacteroides abscessus]|uniref:hypothetical protein n=1 Tax=Mycobacteroides abscessus TaxID=36809 RepID=UPI000925B93E|nr:hypothetical protein [Mycobacteroides abscessus]SHV16328.1 Uncharacterised protein [Mycobacteroides abscessus subsp. abscessus]SHV36180.1 Uncharacterised protein [Mycobacteroides abscessus subsp. abscessus]SHV58073.1 Uncharacterised protein [Mycobacteroides abscessus subsp. abscessus]SHW24903.1 Uncharacterised protein [Mycobacteroides abscessus subsp. abscessus]SHW62194.1 Uncharacterised protein [Mycobacteroides abscessus subsp. abscessus]
MSQHSLVTLLVVVSLAAIGLFTLALLLRWRDRQAMNQQAAEHHRRLAAIRRSQRQAERHIDHLTLAAIEHLLTTTRRTDLQ